MLLVVCIPPTRDRVGEHDDSQKTHPAFGTRRALVLNTERRIYRVFCRAFANKTFYGFTMDGVFVGKTIAYRVTVPVSPFPEMPESINDFTMVRDEILR
jgi:hypothetical protein